MVPKGVEAMVLTLHEQIVGSWKLVSYRLITRRTGEVIFPLGARPLGFILYTQDGYMSAQLMRPDRPNFVSGDWREGTFGEYREQVRGYLAYSGPYDVDEATQTLHHSMVVSLFPNWVGQIQPRGARIVGDQLTLSTDNPVPLGGEMYSAHLMWQRALRRSFPLQADTDIFSER